MVRRLRTCCIVSCIHELRRLLADDILSEWRSCPSTAQLLSGPPASHAPLLSPSLLPASPGFRIFGIGEGAELVGSHPGLSSAGSFPAPSPSRLGPSWLRFASGIDSAVANGVGSGALNGGAVEMNHPGSPNHCCP